MCLLLLGLPALAQDMSVPPPDELKAWRKITHTDAESSSTCIGRIDTLSCALDTEMACHFRGDPALCKLAYRAGTVWREMEGGRPEGYSWFYKLRSAALYKGENLLETLDAISESAFNVYAPLVLNSLRKPRPGDVLVMVDRVRCYSPRTDADCIEEGWSRRNVAPLETLVFRSLPGQGWQAVGDRIDPAEIAARMAAERARLPHLPPPDPPGQWRRILRDGTGSTEACGVKTHALLCVMEQPVLCYMHKDPKACVRARLDIREARASNQKWPMRIYRLTGALEYRGEEYLAAIEPLLGYYVDPFNLRYMELGEMRKGDILIGLEVQHCKTTDVAECLADEAVAEAIAHGDPPGIWILRRDKHGWTSYGIGAPNY